MNHTQRDQLTSDIESVLCIQDVIDDFVSAIAKILQPQDVFSEDKLRDWAEKNGYVVED